MAQEVKDDLRASHFKVGFDNKNVENNRPGSEVKQARPVSNNATQHKVVDVAKQTNFNLQANSQALRGDYKTTHKAAFKWIQPSLK